MDSTVDTSLLDMCRNLEEENIELTETIADLKNQLAEAKREAAASKLIPHYRLAVMRYDYLRFNPLDPRHDPRLNRFVEQRLTQTILPNKSNAKE